MNVLILDTDEKQIQEITKEIMSVVSNARISICQSNMQAYKVILEESIDLVITEIKADNGTLDGVDILRQARVKNPELQSIIVTECKEYMLDAIDIRPYGFHIKPIDLKILRTQLVELWDRIKREKRKNNHFYDRFVIRNRSEYLCVPFNEILFFETHSKRTSMHERKNEIHLKRNLTELEKELPSQFLRIHKSYIANINNVSKITEIGNRSYEVSFYNSDKIALMSRYKAEKIFKIIKEYSYD